MKKRIEELEKEIEEFDYQRLKRQEIFQEKQNDFHQALAQIRQAILTRKGEIIGLKRLLKKEDSE